MMGAEESGGFGFGMHLPERDGIYADLLLLDLFLRERAAGRWPVSKAIEHFHEIAGPSFYRRIDVHVERAAYPERQAAAARRPRRERRRPSSPAQPVARTCRSTPSDGFKFFLADGSWLLVRASRHGAARPGLHGGDLGRPPRRDPRRRRAAGPRHE